jgi:alkanesulfonate monooxygenase SsuD/methylene tetrahydromethanopterin reductase-like flavin-dependent oxidoreductase (luciferase family)
VRYAINVPNAGDPSYADPASLVRMAVAAEQAGWDGFFIWDHVLFGLDGPPVVDPWITLAAMATATSRIRIGPMVTALPRRRPWMVARQAVAIDHLSGGRLILGVGLGAPVEIEFAPFHEPTDLRVRAGMLDESLGILAGLWTGRPFSFQGEHHHLDEVTFLPTPVQEPRIPIWVAGIWPNRAPLRRAARWDGFVPERGDGYPTPEDIAAIRAEAIAMRGDDRADWDLVAVGETSGQGAEDTRRVAAYAAAGATWWSERLTPARGDIDAVMRRIAGGPPRVD